MNCFGHQLLICTVVLFAALLEFATATVYNFKTLGGIENEKTYDVGLTNAHVFNTILTGLKTGDTLVFPNTTFFMMGGITATGLEGVTVQFDGTIEFASGKKALKHWPQHETPKGKKRVQECMKFVACNHMTFTSSGKGLIDGNGASWWGAPGVGYLKRGENRPRLLMLEGGQHNLVENLILKNSPYWTFFAKDVEYLEVRHVDISARRTQSDGHSAIDLTAFNTDGFDVSGSYVWIHDCTVWNQDDCVCVKDGSEHMLFERIEASGLGLTVGSIGSSINRNITFRDIHMHKTYKGIYMKFRQMDNGGLVEDVLYENIFMDAPQQWPIWIGPAQQSDSPNLCAAHPCSICWPRLPSKLAPCHSGSGQYKNIVLRNITVLNSQRSPGVLMGNITTPITGLVFDSVKFVHPGREPWKGEYYKCSGVDTGIALGDTHPVPDCLEDKTTPHKGVV